MTALVKYQRIVPLIRNGLCHDHNVSMVHKSSHLIKDLAVTDVGKSTVNKQVRQLKQERDASHQMLFQLRLIRLKFDNQKRKSSLLKKRIKYFKELGLSAITFDEKLLLVLKLKGSHCIKCICQVFDIHRVVINTGKGDRRNHHFSRRRAIMK